MRPVQIYKYEKVAGEQHFDKVEDEKGYFHQFGISYEEFEAGPGNYSTAIVELSDGSIRAVDAENIKFLDKE